MEIRDQVFTKTPETEERFLHAVQQVMLIQDITTGGADQSYLVRYRGRLLLDSKDAYDKLEPVFSSQGTTLLFREVEGQHEVLAIPGLARPRPSNAWVNLGMFVLTVLSVIYAGVVYQANDASVFTLRGAVAALLEVWPDALLYAGSLLTILLAHEFGHYLAARRHGTAVSLPYFLPFPGSLFGTLGAFIRLKEPPRNRRVLLDIGLAGPLAGLVVAIPVTLIGLSLSKVGPVLSPSGEGGALLEGNSILYLALKYLVKGELLPTPATYGGVPPALYWIRYVLLGLPAPIGGRDVILHPVAWAGWAGLLVTALNLIPAGQLDGGHTVYVLLGRRAIRLWPFIVVGLLALGLAWSGWFLWAGLIFFLGRTYAQPLDEITSLDGRRRSLALLGLAVFMLVFIPVPFRAFLGV